MVIHVELESPCQRDIALLIEELDAYHSTLYPAEVCYTLDLTLLEEQDLLFAVARDGAGVAIGCGALVLNGEAAELKRMFVRPQYRGRGAAAKVLAKLEAEAAQLRCRLVLLETGPFQPEALAFYKKHGFHIRGAFGAYSEHPLSVFMEKRLGDN